MDGDPRMGGVRFVSSRANQQSRDSSIATGRAGGFQTRSTCRFERLPLFSSLSFVLHKINLFSTAVFFCGIPPPQAAAVRDLEAKVAAEKERASKVN